VEMYVPHRMRGQRLAGIHEDKIGFERILNE